MHILLKKLLKKRGIVDSSKLTQEESEEFSRWNEILSESGVTVDKIKTFCEIQLKLIENQWSNLDNTALKNERLVIQHTVYRGLLNLIDAPKTEKERVEKYLSQLLDA